MSDNECWIMLRTLQLAFWYAPRTRHDFKENIQNMINVIRNNMDSVEDKDAFLYQLDRIIP